MEDNKVILFDSPEAATYETNIEGWVSRNRLFCGKDQVAERMAREDGCTHKKCECGELVKKESYRTCCDNCWQRKQHEKFLKTEYKEWDGNSPVFLYDSDDFFFDLDALQEYMVENEIEKVHLSLSTPIYYSPIDEGDIASECHENWEPSAELERRIIEFNEYLETLPPHSYTTSKYRSSYTLPEEITKEFKKQPPLR